MATARFVEVDGRNDISPIADGDDRRLIDEVGQVGAREAGRAAGDRPEVDVGREVLAPSVGRQYFGPLDLIGERDLHLAVETARSQECWIENFRAICCPD